MRKLKWFTLVEILIVIVIIGILIWALVPRMQSAQWRARDVARKNDLSQLQAAIVTSFQDKGRRPWLPDASNWIDISAIGPELLAAWLNGVPTDPLKSSSFEWIWDNPSGEWQYRYLVVKSYGADKWWFVLMAKTEVEGWSNWVVCDTAWSSSIECPANADSAEDCPNGCTWNGSGTPKCSGTYTPAGSTAGDWKITSADDIRDLKPCWSLTKDTTLDSDVCINQRDGSECKYENESQLRYVLFN